MDKILTVNDVAEILQVKAITVREMFRENRLRGFKVGKAWRTTRDMLQEDIAALARGEKPGELNGHDKSAASPPSQPAEAAVAPAEEVGKGAPQNRDGKPARARKPRKAEEVPANTDAKGEQEKVDDTQQLLF